MSLFPNSETTVKQVTPEPRTLGRAAPRRSPRRLHEHHVFAIALACFYFAVFLFMQANRQFVGLTPIERDVTGIEGWPLIVCACCELPGLLAGYRRRILMNQGG